MQTTVKDILAIDDFQDVKMLAGFDGLSRVVNNVYFMEVPDIFGYISPEGLLMTTLYPIAGNMEAIEQLIPKLVDLNLSGIAIKPGRYVDEIPDIMINQANEYSFPLMVLPNEANLSQLSNSILEHLLGKKNSILEFRDEVHNKLMKLLLEGADLPILIQSLFSIIGEPVILINQAFELITSCTLNNEEVEIIKPKGQSRNAQIDMNEQLKVVINGKEYSSSELYVNPIYANRECLGYLIAVSFDHDSNMTVAIEQASILIAFVFQREEAIQQKERNYLDSFIRDVLNQKLTSQLEVIQKARVFKWDLEFPMILLNIKIIDKNEEELRKIYTEIIDIQSFELMIAEKLDISPKKCKMVYYGDSLVCFISVVFENKIEERLDIVCGYLIDHFKRRFNIGIGISETISNVQQLVKAHEQTKLILGISEMLTPNSSFSKRYSELGVYKLIHHIHDQEVLKEYVNEKLGKIIEHQQKDRDLLDTLMTLIRNNMNVQKTAKDLYVHYNTLRYRIDKLKELGITINNGFEMAELALAYQIYLLTNNKR